MKAVIRAGVFCIALGLCANGHAANVAPGQAVPDFALKDSTGQDHKLADYKDKVLVLVFDSPNCPFSRGADPTLNELATKYKDKGVGFLGVDANSNVTPEDLNKHIAEAKVPYPILKDDGNKYADTLGAKVTPELFVVGKDGKLVYHGALDNRTSPTGSATEHYADDALKAALEGKAAQTQEVQAWGCGIHRARKG